MASSFLVSLIFSLFIFVYLCSGQDIDTKSKSVLIEGVLQKIFNLSLASFANIPTAEKEKMMIKIEQKLKKSAESLNKGLKSDHYVAIIMEGIRSKASENKWSNNVDYDKRDSIENEKNSDAVAQAMIRSKKQNRKKNDSKKIKARRMEFEFSDTISVNTGPKDDEVEDAEPNNNEALNEFKGRKSNRIDAFKDLPDKIDLKNVSFEPPCYVKNKMMCLKIKALRTIKCNSKEISIEKLCDGTMDCFDYTDERDCALQGVDKIGNASQIMKEIEHSLSEKCYTAKIDDSLLAKQKEIMRHVLQTQLKFIQKHANVKDTSSIHLRKFNVEPKKVMKAVNEVAVVIITLSSSLESALCSSIVEGLRKSNDIDDGIQKDFGIESIKANTWSPKYCTCDEEYCVGKCSADCVIICLQRYDLGRWQCRAVCNKKTIPLGLICDGKLDCYDEADEKGCTTVSGLSKFESANMYSLTLDMISTKAKSAKFEKIRSKFINLRKQIEKLQKLTTKRKTNVHEIQALRETCFSEMTAIYDETRLDAPSMDLIYDIHDFLMSVNEKLVSAMKLSHIGNDKIITPDGCFCREGICALPICYETCNRACSAEPKLTRYFCGGSLPANKSIPIEAICNGKDDCPGQDDEEGCSKDICRKHHLVLLRHNIKKATEEDKDTTFGGALQSWETKVSAMLAILETTDRPSLLVLRDHAKDMLHDLTMSYAGLTSTKRRSNDDVIDHFYKVALTVMSTLKSCAK